MNRKIFITYGDSRYTESLKRICKEAEACGEFDEVIAYTENDLDEEVTHSELFSHSRGGGTGSGSPLYASESYAVATKPTFWFIQMPAIKYTLTHNGGCFGNGWKNIVRCSSSMEH